MQEQVDKTFPDFSQFHWEHSPRRHGRWTKDRMTRVAYISLSPPQRMGGPPQTMYRWHLDWPHIEAACGETKSLAQAKREVEESYCQTTPQRLKPHAIGDAAIRLFQMPEFSHLIGIVRYKPSIEVARDNAI